MSGAQVHYLGVRHHSPGCAKSVARALDQLSPDLILIEGPPEANLCLKGAAHPNLTPPVALMVSPRDQGHARRAFPLMVYSPEWVALRYAASHQIRVEMIDAPLGLQLGARRDAAESKSREVESREVESREVESRVMSSEESESHDPLSTLSSPLRRRVERARSILHDPLKYLAALDHVEDAHVWWERLIERPTYHGLEPFTLLDERIGALRDEVEALYDELALESVDPALLQPQAERDRELRREAHMRLQVARLKPTARSIVVLCGAWHVSALRATRSIARDQALLRGFQRIKADVSWLPWSHALMTSDQYSAGVETPSWYELLWRHGGDVELVERALCEGAAGLRRRGAIIPSASVMDAVHLTRALCSIRDRSWVELRDVCEAASVTLCRGEVELTQQLRRHLSVGDRYGEVPAALISVALMRDFTRQRRRLRIPLKPHETEALRLNLVRPRDLEKSVFLTRAQILGLSFERLGERQQSAAHLIERWEINWTPRDELTLSHSGCHGDTLHEAATRQLITRINDSSSPHEIARLAKLSLCAALLKPIEVARHALMSEAPNSERLEPFEAGPLLVEICELSGALTQWSSALQDPSRATLFGDTHQIVSELTALCIWLIDALSDTLTRCPVNLKASELGAIASGLYSAHGSLCHWGHPTLQHRWDETLKQILERGQCAPLIEGRALRCAASRVGTSETLRPVVQDALQRWLSGPERPLLDFERWTVGLVASDPRSLESDGGLLSSLDRWIARLSEESLYRHLPSLRRGFAGCERRANESLSDQLIALWSACTERDHRVGETRAREIDGLKVTDASLGDTRGSVSLSRALWSAQGEGQERRVKLLSLTHDLFSDRLARAVASHDLISSAKISSAQLNVIQAHSPTLSEAEIKERARRWRLILGAGRSLKRRALLGMRSGSPRVWSPLDTLIDEALSNIYGKGERSIGLDVSVSRGDDQGLKALDALRTIEELFPEDVIEVVGGEVSRSLDPSALLKVAREGREVQLSWPLLEQLIARAHQLSDRERSEARALVKPLLDQLQDLFKERISRSFEGELSQESEPSPTARIPWREVNWPRTIFTNLKHYQPELGVMIPERLIRKRRDLTRDADLIICVDQSGSMQSSVIYASVYAAALASLRGVNTRVVLFNHEVTDVSASLVEPIDLIFSARPHGGTDVLPALQYCASLIERPEKTTLIMISDLIDGTALQDLRESASGILLGGAQLLFLLSLSDHGAPVFSEEAAGALKSIGAPALYCTPDHFPDLLRDVLDRRDLSRHA